MNDFKVLLEAVLDANSIKQSDIAKIQKVIEKYHLNLTADLDKASAIAEIKKIVPQLEAELRKMTGVDIKINDDALVKAFNQIEKQADSLAQKVNKIQLLSKEGKFTSQVSDITADYNRLSLVTNELKADFKELQRLETVLTTSKDADVLTQSYEQFNSTLQKVKNSISVLDDQGMMYTSQKKVDNLAESVLKFRDNNTKMSKDLKRQFTSLYNSLINGAKLTDKQVDELTASFATLKLQVREAGQLGQSFGDKMINAFKKFSEWGFATGIVTSATSKLREAATELKEIDTLLTEISKANDSLSASQLAEIGNNSFDVASRYGKKSTDYLSGVQEMSRAGYENAEAMAELSTAAQGAGDMTAELANSYIVATDKAYKMNGSVEALTRTLDGANNITNNNAVNMTELAEGMSVVGAQAASSQMKVEETTAAIATLVAVTQQGGSEMGNAFKGILMNLQQVTGEVDGEEIDTESLTKYEEACQELGVSLKEVKNGVVSLKKPMQILKELSVEYQKLDESDARRANLLSAVGGKYRANALNTILENFSLYEEILQDYAEGEGTMAREAEKTAQSLEGSLNRLSNTWTDTVENILSSELLKDAVNLFNTLLTGVNNLTDALGGLGTVGLLSGVGLGIKNVGEGKMYPFIVLNSQQQYVFFRIRKFSYCQ